MRLTLPYLLGSHTTNLGIKIHDVTVSQKSFNPSQGTHVKLNYAISSAASVSVYVFDGDRTLVRTIVHSSKRRAGPNQEIWDGRDLDGKTVPNEAYFFTIETRDSSGNTAVYDPTTFSGGEFGDIRVGDVDRNAGTVTYQLSQSSRVLLRAGLTGSAMLKTIVDWEARPAGTVTEYWNGKDEDNLIDLLGRKHTMILTYTTLPENSVITYGNSKYSYREYRAKLASKRPVKEERPMSNRRQISPHFLKSRLTDRAFPVKVSFPEVTGASGGISKASGRVIVHLEIDPNDREVLEGQQFEVILFVDTVFNLEEERGYLPFNAPIELGPLPLGEHVITANVITYGDQIGVGSRKLNITQ